MRHVKTEPATEQLEAIEALYGKFDIGVDGRPTPQWEGRNLKKLRMPEMLRSAHFPEVYLSRVVVNRRMMAALERVYLEICVRWTPEARSALGLHKFVKCYCFGEGDSVNLFWYGAAWQLAPVSDNEILAEVVKIFIRHGFRPDGKRVRVFEYW